MLMIIRGLTITHHGHDIGERDPRSVVLVSVKENPEAFKFVRRSKHGTWSSALFCEPHGEAISVQMTSSVNLEFELDLPNLISHI